MFPILLLTACSSTGSAGSMPRILPVDCQVNTGGTIVLSLDGTLPQNANIRWEADLGGVVSTGQKLNAVFNAPGLAEDVTISVYISSGTPGSTEIPVTRNCTVVSPVPVLPIVPTPATVNVASTPLNVDSPSVNNDSLVVNANPIPVTAEPLPIERTLPDGPTVIISEVMAHPCGDDNFKKWNEYVELYNFGDQPVDARGWRLVDNGPRNKPDQIVAWNARNPHAALKQRVVTDSTIIPPHGFALVLSPIYTQSLAPHKMPYQFPEGTVILTIIEGDRLGDDRFGLIGHGSSRDVVVLYIGGSKSIKQVVSTYGTPSLGIYPEDIRDDREDSLPLDLRECSSVERVDPLLPDQFESWREVPNGSPGEAPYQ
jgi:hypothetical protein